MTIENSHPDTLPRPLPDHALARLEDDLVAVGTEWESPPAMAGEVGRTMFDTAASTDTTVTVLLPREHLHRLPSQSTVRIRSHPDGRVYLGVVVAGPFAEPDGLRGDAPLMVTTTVRGAVFMPRYHGRVQVEIVGEELESGATVPPRFRPLPNSPVTPLTAEETARMMGTDKGGVRLGVAVGHDGLTVSVPADSKAVFPRHTAILGTTGGGKSTTVAGMIGRLQREGVAVILLDTEGEYTRLNEPCDDPRMLSVLARARMEAAGVPDTALFHLVGRDTANPAHPRPRAFTLHFDELSPYAVMDILDMTEAQEQRFLQAYDVCKRLLYDLKVYPATEQEREDVLLLDEFTRGYPRMTLLHLYDVIRALANRAADDSPAPLTAPEFQRAEGAFRAAIGAATKPQNVSSWRALLGKFGRLRRLSVFDQRGAASLPYAEMACPGAVSIVDLSDSESPQVNNLAIAELLRGVQEHQEEATRVAEARGERPTPVVVFIEEAHEFLSAERLARMQNLFEQVARIARRGRKRWLGLVFITQLPQHLPDEVFGLVNNYVLHKISDAGVIGRLKRSVSGIDESLWARLPGLAPGQAIVSFTSLSRPLLVAIDPTPCKLRMVD